MSNVPSPLPGIFYRRPSPEEDEYVQVGERVTKGQTLGLIEVMKNFTEFTAPEDGTIEEFLVENEEEVSVGQDIVRLGGAHARLTGPANPNECWWPIAARSPCASSAPPMLWAGRPWPFIRMPMPTRTGWRRRMPACTSARHRRANPIWTSRL